MQSLIPANTVKFATSFIDVKRRKGEITGDCIKLPNGLKFKKEHVLHLLSIVFYCEESLANIASKWASSKSNHNTEYSAHFKEMSTIDAKHARAIMNLIEGLGRKPKGPQKELIEVFDYVAALESWQERIIATELVLRASYANSFGKIFYRVFYPVSPEFMRSFGKAFYDSAYESVWGMNEAKKIIDEDLLPKERLLELTSGLLVRVLLSINANMRLAKASGVENETKLLAEIAIAYPFHTLAKMGVRMDIEKEIKAVVDRAEHS